MTLQRQIKELHDHFIIREPSHFGPRHLVSSFFGSILVALTFMFKGLLFEVSQGLQFNNLVLITLSTWLILSAEIYYIGYARVQQKPKRKFGQFWIKRLMAYYAIGLFVSTTLVYLYGLHLLIGPEFYKIIVAVSFPASLGAAAADLLNKY